MGDNQPLTLRVAVAADLEGIARLERQLFSTPWSLAQLQGSLGGDRWLWVAVQHDMLVGYLVASQGGGVADLLTIGVDPSRQGEGVGRRLLAQLFARLQSEQAEELFLEVRETNAAAQALYLRCGFESVGVRKNYYTDGPVPEHAIVMRSTLRQAKA
ncbi:MAG: ribosomal-protein-alanine N-acetyltransferase [Motiliproteus sp.]